jgi:acyl carrier protein
MAAPPARRQRLLLDLVRAQAAHVLGMDAGRLDGRKPLRDLGLDSLMSVELRNCLCEALHRSLPTTLLFDHPTVEDLTAYLATELFSAEQGDRSAPRSSRGGPDVSPEELQRLAPDELLAMFGQLLEPER